MQTSEMVGSLEACRRIGVTAPTLRKIVRRGDLPVFLDPLDARLRLVRVADLETLRQPVPVRRSEAAEISAA